MYDVFLSQEQVYLSWKRGLINCLIHRAYLYSSNDSLLKTEITRIISLFKQNGYPTSFILNVIEKFKIKFKNQNQQSPTDFSNNTPNLSPYLTLPYIGTPRLSNLVNALLHCFVTD